MLCCTVKLAAVSDLANDVFKIQLFGLGGGRATILRTRWRSRVSFRSVFCFSFYSRVRHSLAFVYEGARVVLVLRLSEFPSDRLSVCRYLCLPVGRCVRLPCLCATRSHAAIPPACVCRGWFAVLIP